MKSIKLFRSLIFLFAVLMLFSCNKQPAMVLSIEDTSGIARTDEPVAISKQSLEDAFGVIPAGKWPLILNETGDTIAVQYDDFSKDGQWDELFFLISLEANTRTSLQLVFVDMDELPVLKPRSNVRFARIQDGEYIPLISGLRLGKEEGLAGDVFQMEGPAWENDKVGFRNYFDVRNGMDIFGKLTERMVLDQVGIADDYHVLQDWGMDILKVGTSLGAGSLALKLDENWHRVAPDADGSYELIADGPIRSVFRMKYENWNPGGQPLTLVHEISIWGGAWFYESKVFIEGLQGMNTLASGITSLDLDDQATAMEMGTFGIVTVASHGEQTIENEFLGMAVMLHEQAYAGHEHIQDGQDITETFMVKMNLMDDTAVSCRFYACWELSDPAFSDQAYFFDFLQKEAAKMASPIAVLFLRDQ